MKEAYNKDKLQIDEDWLRGLGVETEEITEFLISLITEGFKMSRSEYVSFIESVK